MVVVLAERFGWTLPQILSLSLLQLDVVADGVARLESRRAASSAVWGA